MEVPALRVAPEDQTTCLVAGILEVVLVIGHRSQSGQSRGTINACAGGVNANTDKDLRTIVH